MTQHAQTHWLAILLMYCTMVPSLATGVLPLQLLAIMVTSAHSAAEIGIMYEGWQVYYPGTMRASKQPARCTRKPRVLRAREHMCRCVRWHHDGTSRALARGTLAQLTSTRKLANLCLK